MKATKTKRGYKLELTGYSDYHNAYIAGAQYGDYYYDTATVERITGLSADKITADGTLYNNDYGQPVTLADLLYNDLREDDGYPAYNYYMRRNCGTIG